MSTEPTSSPTTLYEQLVAVATARPEAVAIVDGSGAAPDLDYGGLLARARDLAADLRGHGVGPGDRIGVYLPNWPESVVWQYAASALGACVIGINTRYGDADVEHVVERSAPTVVAIAHDFLGLPLQRRLRAAAEQSPHPPPSVAVVAAPGAPTPNDADVPGYDCGAGAWLPRSGDAGKPDEFVAESHPDELAVAFTTSGSTGKPKLAAHTGANTIDHLRHCAAGTGMGPDSVSLVNLPLSGVLAFVPAYATLTGGGKIVLQPSFDPRESLALLKRFEVTHLTCADDIAGRIKEAWEQEPVDLDHFRMLLFADFYGSSGSIATWVEEDLHASAVGIFGSSEVFALLTFWHSDDPLPQRWSAGGHPAGPDVEVRIVDQLDGRPVQASETGEIEVRGGPVVDRYLGDDGTVYAGNVDDEGWFHTGDQGRMPDPDSLVYTTRLSDALRLKGFLVEPIEIESVMAEVDEVAVAKVVGVTVGVDTQAIGFVSPREGATIDTDVVLRHCAERLAKYKVPSALHVLEDMPMTVGTNGSKIRSAELRRIAQERL